MDLTKYEFWFLTGSQHLYGEKTLKHVKNHSLKITEELNKSKLPYRVICKDILTDANKILSQLNEANSDNNCAGIICWMHTFSPAKIWIKGLSALNKPMLELNTQFNVEIPYNDIDMDFMNLNQSAHGDREFGFITSRMNIPRKVVAGHWSDKEVKEKISTWMRASVAYIDGRDMTIVRFGDNMRDVAVTDGDKVEAMIKFGWSVPYHPVGDLVKYINEVSDLEINRLMKEYQDTYNIIYGKNKEYTISHIKEQAKMEIAIRTFLQDKNAKAFTNTFQDLHGMKQLPGLATQRLMNEGYGFGAEGDWKLSALVRTIKVMGNGLKGGTSFMEDYTYHFEEKNMMNLGAHMLEVCPSIADSKPNIEVHELGIGDREAPARLVFNGAKGKALCVSIVEMNGRFRMVANKVDAVKIEKNKFLKLPVARVLWKPMPDLITAAESWILAGGGHHTVYSNAIDLNYLIDYAEMSQIELLIIDENTKVNDFRKEIRWNEAYWNIKY